MAARRMPRSEAKVLGLSLGDFGPDGYDSFGFNLRGWDREGYDRQGFNKEGKTHGSFDIEGDDSEGFDHAGWSSKGLNRAGQHKDSFPPKLILHLYQEVRAREKRGIWLQGPARIDESLYPQFFEKKQEEAHFRTLDSSPLPLKTRQQIRVSELLGPSVSLFDTIGQARFGGGRENSSNNTLIYLQTPKRQIEELVIEDTPLHTVETPALILTTQEADRRLLDKALDKLLTTTMKQLAPESSEVFSALPKLAVQPQALPEMQAKKAEPGKSMKQPKKRAKEAEEKEGKNRVTQTKSKSEEAVDDEEGSELS